MRKQVALNATERAKVCLRYGVYPRTSADVPCYWCGRHGQLWWTMNKGSRVGWSGGRGMEFDHFIPLSLGGPNTAENVVVACRTCNRSRCNRPKPKERRGSDS